MIGSALNSAKDKIGDHIEAKKLEVLGGPQESSNAYNSTETQDEKTLNTIIDMFKLKVFVLLVCRASDEWKANKLFDFLVFNLKNKEEAIV